MRYLDATATLPATATVALGYTTVDVPSEDLLSLSKKWNIPLFGCTSFQGVFTPHGFKRGAHFLVWEKEDGVELAPGVVACGEDDAREKVKQLTLELVGKIGKPDMVLMHATPGFEERVIQGIEDAIGPDIPIYGGSAADDDVSGSWWLFCNGEVVRSGALIVAMRHTKGQIYGGFLGGYFPSKHKGRVTRCKGRVIYEIDGRAAAEVYNEWTGGAISEYLKKGGVILGATTMHPLGRVIGDFRGIPQYLLSHPHMVDKETKALSCFTEFEEGDEVVLMDGFKSSLIERTSLVYERALSFHRRDAHPQGGILIYCGGCVGAIIDKVQEVNAQYVKAIGSHTPFVGAATFGEEGCMYEKGKVVNRHGNLMTDTIVFVR